MNLETTGRAEWVNYLVDRRYPVQPTGPHRGTRAVGARVYELALYELPDEKLKEFVRSAMQYEAMQGLRDL